MTPEELDAKVADLSYEDARSRLVETVTRLEQGNLPLEEALSMWELGEALARRCEAWLDGARLRLRAAQMRTAGKDDSAEARTAAAAAPIADAETAPASEARASFAQPGGQSRPSNTPTNSQSAPAPDSE